MLANKKEKAWLKEHLDAGRKRFAWRLEGQSQSCVDVTSYPVSSHY